MPGLATGTLEDLSEPLDIQFAGVVYFYRSDAFSLPTNHFKHVKMITGNQKLKKFKWNPVEFKVISFRNYNDWLIN